MKNTPVLDPRDADALMEEIAERAKQYTPQWRFDPDDMDAGGALAALFARMYAQTIDRYNGVLHKDYIEFLNLLAVRQQPVTPAQGIAALEIAPGTEQPARIERDTLFYHEAEDGTRVNFLSDESIFATPARITGMITVDPEQDAIALRDMEQDETFALFHVQEERNLQRHAFTLQHDEALRLSRPAVIRVQVGQTAQYLAQQTAQRLARADFARWEYFSGGQWRAFDETACDGDCVVLRKDNDLPVESEPAAEEGGETGLCIRCTMKKTADNTALDVRDLRVDSCYRDGVWLPCDEAYANDVRMDAVYGGYCFSEPMLQYDCFYVASDEVLCKRGAQVELRMQMHTMVRKSDQEQARYEFKDKFVIDKDATPPEPAKKYVSRVVWEYWNGVGWTHLAVSGDVNPFGLDAEGEKVVTFALPEDAQPAVVSSVERCWVRARAVFVENAYDIYATQLWPMARDVQLRYRYPACRCAQQLVTENNLQRMVHRAEGGELPARLFDPLPDERPALYLCFDDAPAGYPVPLYLELMGRAEHRRRIQTQAYMARGFEEVRSVNDLAGCTRAGILALYLPVGLKETTIFGMTGWFVRITDQTARRGLTSFPRVGSIIPNCVRITQRERAADMAFSTDIHEAHKHIRLDERPVLQASVWVDELTTLSESARREALQDADNARAEWNGDGSPARLFLRWHRVETLALCGAQERAYELDAEEGSIRFGDGVHGAIPPAGEENIRVEYSFGGGARGNVPENGVTGINTTESGVMRVYNFLPVCGGNDAQSMELVEQLGPQRLRHRGRAVTAADFEALVMEEFSEVRAVRCFANTDERGARAPGRVTVVVHTAADGSQPHALALCDHIERYLKERCDGRLAREGLSVIPAQVMTVSVTARIEVDDLENAAEAERGAIAALEKLLEPGTGRQAIGALPEPAQLYAALRKVRHVAAVRDVLMEGGYYDYNISRIAPLEAGSRYPFAVPHNGRHSIRIG